MPVSKKTNRKTVASREPTRKKKPVRRTTARKLAPPKKKSKEEHSRTHRGVGIALVILLAATLTVMVWLVIRDSDQSTGADTPETLESKVYELSCDLPSGTNRIGESTGAGEGISGWGNGWGRCSMAYTGSESPEVVVAWSATRDGERYYADASRFDTRIGRGFTHEVPLPSYHSDGTFSYKPVFVEPGTFEVTFAVFDCGRIMDALGASCHDETATPAAALFESVAPSARASYAFEVIGGSLTTDDTLDTGGEAYASPVYNFSLNYPSEWTIRPESNHCPYDQFSAGRECSNDIAMWYIGPAVSVYLSHIGTNEDKLPLDVWLDQATHIPPGVQAVWERTTDGTLSIEGLSPEVYQGAVSVFFEHQGNVFELQWLDTGKKADDAFADFYALTQSIVLEDELE